MLNYHGQIPTIVAAAAVSSAAFVAPGIPDIPDASPPRDVEVTPQTISAAEFVAEEDAVTITVDDFLVGEEVRLHIVSMPDNIEAFHLSERAQPDGTVTFSIAGAPGRNPNTYAGEYLAEINSVGGTDDDIITETFSVVPALPGDHESSRGRAGDDSGRGSAGQGGGSGEGVSVQDSSDDKPATQISGFSALGVGLSVLVLGTTTLVSAFRKRRDNP